MTQRSSFAARALAATAVACGFVALIVVIASSLGGGATQPAGDSHAGTTAHRVHHSKKVPATYVVQSGDTLTAIAHKTGVPVARIVALNPRVDPQILIAGEKLKLR